VEQLVKIILNSVLLAEKNSKMKIIESKKYNKLKVSTFEGQVLTPETEDKWVNWNEGIQKRRRELPTNPVTKKKRVEYKARGQERIPNSSLQEILKDKNEKENIFNTKFSKYKDVAKWITQIRNKETRDKLISYYKDIASKGVEGYNDLETLVLAAQGNQESLNKLKRILEVNKISTMPELENKYFY